MPLAPLRALDASPGPRRAAVLALLVSLASCASDQGDGDGPGDAGHEIVSASSGAPNACAELWDGTACPAGTLRSFANEVWCEVDGQRDGPSRALTVNGETVGHWAADAPDGRWLECSGGLAYHEWFVAAGALEGVERWWSGSIVTELITWHDDEREGPYQSAYADGARHCAGNYAHDLRDGVWSCLHPNGAVELAGPYVHGKRQGTFTIGDPSGDNGAEGPYVDDQPDGEWRFWRTIGPEAFIGPENEGVGPPEAGRVEDRGRYEYGLMAGTWTERWVSDDRVMSTVVYAYGVRHGPFASYYRNGNPMDVGPLVDDAPHGVWSYYYRDGQLRIEATWFKGALEGPYRELWPNGRVKTQGIYYGDFLLDEACWASGDPDTCPAPRWDEEGNPLP